MKNLPPAWILFSINWCFSRRELLICALRSFFYCRFLMTLLPGRTHCSTIHFCLTFCSFMTPFVLLLQQNVMNVKQMVSLNLIPARELVEQRVSFFLLNFDLFFSWFFHFFEFFSNTITDYLRRFYRPFLSSIRSFQICYMLFSRFEKKWRPLQKFIIMHSQFFVSRFSICAMRPFSFDYCFLCTFLAKKKWLLRKLYEK